MDARFRRRLAALEAEQQQILEDVGEHGRLCPEWTPEIDEPHTKRCEGFAQLMKSLKRCERQLEETRRAVEKPL